MSMSEKRLLAKLLPILRIADGLQFLLGGTLTIESSCVNLLGPSDGSTTIVDENDFPSAFSCKKARAS
jgi:hypothetical protein